MEDTRIHANGSVCTEEVGECIEDMEEVGELAPVVICVRVRICGTCSTLHLDEGLLTCRTDSAHGLTIPVSMTTDQIQRHWDARR